MFESLKVHARFLSCLLPLVIGCGQRILGQAPAQPPSAECRGDASLQGMPIHAVKVEARGGWHPLFTLPLAKGDKFDFPKLSEAIDTVRKALITDPLRDSFELAGQGSLSLTFVSSCVTVLEASACGPGNDAASSSGCLDVVIRPFSLRLDMLRIGGNAIPVPRSNRATFYSQVPRPLRAFEPTFATQHDSETGWSESVSLSSDLLTLPAMLRGQIPKERETKLNLELRGSKSINEPFYETSSNLTVLRRQTGKLVEEMALSTGFSADQQPLAEGRHFNNLARLGGSLTLRPGFRAASTVALAGNYRWSGHRFFNRDNTEAEVTGENSFEGRALVDGRIADGTWRVGAWLEANAPEKNSFGAYQRLAILGGYQGEFGKSEQTVGVEVLAGAGHAWGEVPDYGRFYGGNGMGSFLYDSPSAVSLRAMPSGPLLRSFGRAQAGARNAALGVRGGTSYWHFNANVTIPIPKLSCPLIPAIALNDDALGDNSSANLCSVRRPPAGVKTLKDSLKGMVNTGESFLSADIADELIAAGMSDTSAEAEATKRAARIFRDIRPAMSYLTEKANLYAVKPLFMLDVGRVGIVGLEHERTRVGLGGGIQLVVAIAKFEVGYVGTVRRLPSEPAGNFILRIVFQNLF
jgi:hypothetical protein